MTTGAKSQCPSGWAEDIVILDRRLEVVPPVLSRCVCACVALHKKGTITTKQWVWVRGGLRWSARSGGGVINSFLSNGVMHNMHKGCVEVGGYLQSVGGQKWLTWPMGGVRRSFTENWRHQYKAIGMWGRFRWLAFTNFKHKQRFLHSRE